MGVVCDQQHGAFVIGQRADQGFAGVDIQVVGGFVEDQQLRGVARGQGQQQARFFAAGEVAAGGFSAIGIQAEAGELSANHGRRGARQSAGHVGDRRFVQDQLVGLVLGEVADFQFAAAADVAGDRIEPSGDKFGQRGLAVAVGAEQGDAVVHIHTEVDIAQHRHAAIADGDVIQRQDRRGEPRRFGEGKAGGGVLHHRFEGGEFFQGLDAGLGLAGLGGLGAEAVHERLHVGALGGDALGGAALLHGLLGADAHELVVTAGGQTDFLAVEMGDGVHRAVQQAAIVADDDGGAGEFGQPGFQPERGFEVQVVGGFVQQQQIGVGEQGGGQGHAHAPAAGEFADRAGLRRGIEAEAGQDSGGARGGGVGADGQQAFVDFGQMVRVGGFDFCQQGEAFLVAFQHGFQQRGAAAGGFLLHLSHAGAGGEADFAAVGVQVAGDGFQQRGFAGAVAADEADTLAGVDGQVGAVQQGAAAHADGEGGDCQEAHEAEGSASF